MPLRFAPRRGAAGMVLNSLVRGPQGATGSAATISAGTTTTGAEGTSAAVANSGSSSAAVFDFTIPRGAMPATGFNFNTATTDSDKDAGDIWFNHATPASVTVIYFDNADRDGNSVTSWLDSFDDPTAAIKGRLHLIPAATPSAKLIFNVTGSVTDGTGYRKVVVTHVSGTTLPSDNAHIGVLFAGSGNDGADGEMAGPVSSTDNAVARFDGTDGSTVQNSGVIVDDSNNVSGIAALSATTIELGHASDTTIARTGSGAISVEGVGVALNSISLTHTASTIELGHASDTTLSRDSAGVLAVEGVTVALNSASAVHTASTIELGHASDTTISRTGAGAIAVEGVGVALNSTSLVHTASTIELGHASDTTLSRVSAGVLGVEGKSVATLSTAQAWTAHQYVTLGTLTDAANIDWTVSTAQKAKVTLGGNRTMNAVTGAVEGATYFLWVIQDGTGTRTITWTTSGAGSFDFGADGAPTLTTTASKADLLCFEAISIGGTLKLRFAGIKKAFT